jgi:hypothetical protein
MKRFYLISAVILAALANVYPAETIGTKEGGMPGDRSTPIMASYHGCFLVDGIK